MRINSLSAEPVAHLTYLNAGGSGRTERVRLPLIVGRAEGLPADVDGLIITSDLQGRMADERLLGEVVPGWLERLTDKGDVPPLARMGAMLCGDLYAKPGSVRRGGKGDIRSVWAEFRGRCRWVAGVAGNHDLIGESPQDFAAFRRSIGAGFLDATTVRFDGIQIAGLSGVIGDPRKPFRRLEADFLAAFDAVLTHRPDIVLTHDGPDAPDQGGLGIPAVRERLLRYPQPILVCRGHAYWETPLVQLSATCQVLNVDARVVVLMHEGSD